MSLYEINGHEPFVAPALVTALDGWVDAGGCATTAAAHIADGGDVVATLGAGDIGKVAHGIGKRIRENRAAV
jgi:hypothetical protein